jgi:ABC-type molybdate transport system substrate-binding protein
MRLITRTAASLLLACGTSVAQANPADDAMCHTAVEAARNHYGFCALHPRAPCTTALYADFAFDIMTVALCAHAGNNEEAKRFVEFLKSESDYYKKSTTR